MVSQDTRINFGLTNKREVLVKKRLTKENSVYAKVAHSIAVPSPTIMLGSEQGISESESVTDSSEARDVFDDGWTAKSKFKNSKNATDSEP